MNVKYQIRHLPYRPEDFVQLHTGKPFLINPRASLIHRVRSVVRFFYHGKFSHESAQYWCGNIGRGELVDLPPDGRLLCERCEKLAIKFGEKSASEIAGHHIHVGIMKPSRVCCKDAKN